MSRDIKEIERKETLLGRRLSPKIYASKVCCQLFLTHGILVLGGGLFFGDVFPSVCVGS